MGNLSQEAADAVSAWETVKRHTEHTLSWELRTLLLEHYSDVRALIFEDVDDLENIVLLGHSDQLVSVAPGSDLCVVGTIKVSDSPIWLKDALYLWKVMGRPHFIQLFP